jgi:hypothetical protein
VRCALLRFARVNDDDDDDDDDRMRSLRVRRSADARRPDTGRRACLGVETGRLLQVGRFLLRLCRVTTAKQAAAAASALTSAAPHTARQHHAPARRRVWAAQRAPRGAKRHGHGA